jgi:DNA-binding MarR family transcriptional regulator
MPRLLLETFLPYRLNRLSAAVSERLKAVYGRKWGLTIPEWRVLATLGQADPLTARQIGRHSAMHKTKVSRAVAALEERRWLARSENPADRREEFLSLTAAGRRAYDAIVPEMAGFEAALLARLGPDGAAAVQTGLRRLEQALDIASPEPAPADPVPSHRGRDAVVADHDPGRRER